MLEIIETVEIVELEKITVREAFLALEKNGFQHVREDWTTETVRGVIKGGCILQQGAMNLGVVAQDDSDENDNSLYSQLNRFETFNTVENIDREEEEQESEGLGSAIIGWNDKYDAIYDKNGRPVTDKHGYIKKRYVLRTYEEVVAKALEIFEPFFDETITLEKHQWKFKRKEK